MSALLRAYGVQTDIYFPLVKAGVQNFAVSGDYTHTSGDVKISKDGGAAATATNAPSAITMGNGAMWKLTLTATEMQAKTIIVTVIDAATKAVEDQMIIIDTYGDTASAQIALSDVADAVLTRPVTTKEGSAGSNNLLTVVLATLHWAFNGSNWLIKRTDGTTTHATVATSNSASANPITGVG